MQRFLLLLAAAGCACAQESDASLLQAQAAGMNLSATPAERGAMHRATALLIERAVQRGSLLQASSLAMLQRGNYRNLDRDYVAALAASQQALDLMQKSGRLETLDLAWDNLGRDQLAVHDPAAALESFRQARQLERGALTTCAGWAWRDSIEAELSLKQIAVARDESVRFLEAAKSAPNDYRASAWMAAASVSLEDKQFDLALDHLKAALAAGANSWEAAPLLADCNLLALRTLNYDQALALARRIDSEFTSLPFSVSAFAQATILARRRMAGDIDGVLRDQTAVLAAARDAKDVQMQIQALRSLATSYRSANNVTGQIQALKEALVRFENAGAPANALLMAEHLRSLNALGDAYLALAHPLPGAARKCFRESIRMAATQTRSDWQKSAASPYAEAILGTARVEALDDDAEDGRKMLEEALRGLPALADFNRADVLFALAHLEREDHRNAKAAQYYRQAVDAYHNEDRLANEAAARIELAHFLLTAPVAEPAMRETVAANLTAAEDLAAQLNLAEPQWRAPYERGILAEVSGQAATALQQYHAAISILEKLRSGLSVGDQQKSFVDRDVVQDLYRRALTLIASRHNDAETWDMLERTKARVFLDALGNKRFRVDKDAEPGAAQVNALETSLASFRLEANPANTQLLALAGRTPDKSKLAALEIQIDFARQQDSLGRTRGGNTLAANPISLDRVRKLLPEKTALIEFGLMRNGAVAMVLTRESGRPVSIDLNVAELAAEIKRLQFAFANAGDSAALLHDISQLLLIPALADLPAGIERLILVPAGFLLEVPFHALETAGGLPLIDRFTVSYLPSASVLEFLPAKTDAPRSVFIGALGNVQVEGMPALEGTLQEAAAIAKLYPGSDRASETQFTHDRARDAFLTHDLVHLATHGLFDHEAPMFSGVVTAPAAHEPSRLTLYDFADMRIRAQTVVLSACETGVGQSSGGDEVAGLTRSILLSGANTVVSSLWKVSDQSTALLMQEFHRQLISGSSAANALRVASLQVRKQFPDPYFWAPFMVTGIN